jgi:hypothetical protein
MSKTLAVQRALGNHVKEIATVGRETNVAVQIISARKLAAMSVREIPIAVVLVFFQSIVVRKDT